MNVINYTTKTAVVSLRCLLSLFNPLKTEENRIEKRRESGAAVTDTTWGGGNE
jgi:hypothetical protein